MSFSILDSIGNTPLVEIKKLNPNPKVKILAKLEYMNPGGSIKDRAALSMIEAGEKSGQLTPDKIVIEATSGNTGIGLALVCAVKGYRLLLAMSEAASVERQKILKARGADILLTPGHLGTDGAIEEVYRQVRENPGKYFMTDQFNNEANWRAHYFGTAEEIWRQTNGQVTMVVATMGTTGTLMGLSRRLKEYRSNITIVGVEPYLGHKIQGLKNMKEAYRPEIYEKDRLDKKINIEDEDAFEMARRLAKEEGIFVGMSSGAAMSIAAREAELLSDGIIVVIFPDGGERYLSTTLFNVREKIDLKLFNSLTRSKTPFHPIVPGKVSMYSCGPTVHTRMHLGECRRFVFADLLSRYLEYRGFHVTHVINITDFDDNTIEGSEKAGLNVQQFTAPYIEQFHKDLEWLGVRPATMYPKASDHLSDMVQLAEKLVKKGVAYEKLRSLYFDISKFPEYGKLSGINLDKIKLGATVDLDEYEKENPRDFTLMKRAKLSELRRGIYVKTDWGNVRPSWHIQCTAIAMKYLGQSFDIHTSSQDLIFPHHENEIAIASAITGKPLASYWIHCNNVLYSQKKDSDLPLTIQDLIDQGFSGREIRYWFISNHYRKPLTYSPASIHHSRQAIFRLDSCVQRLRDVKGNHMNPEVNQLLYDMKQQFITAMDDDLNISAALSSIFTHVKKINILCSQNQIDETGANKIIETFKNINQVLNIFNFDMPQVDPEICRLMQERDRARQEKNWKLADAIRDQLIQKGVIIRDSKI